MLWLLLAATACSPPPTEVNSATIGLTSLGPATSTGDGSGSLDAGTEDGTGTGGEDTDTGGTTGPDFDPVCGDGVIEGQEECDLGTQNGEGDYCTTDCKSNVCGDGYVGPGEACDDGNAIDDDQCTNSCGSPNCGDGIVQEGEDCDLGMGNSETGACLPSCIAASCGDLFIHQNVETCDGNNTGSADCISEGFADGGTLLCQGNCMGFDTSNCHECGNGDVEPTEVCDGTQFDMNVTCQDYAPGGSVASGDLVCVANCTNIDSSGCMFCGDGVLQGTEPCDGAELGGQDCAGLGFTGGSLGCMDDCGGFDTSGCNNFMCGNDMQEGAEVCDGSDLDGEDCASQGFVGGTLACMGNCSGFDTSGCSNCGNDIQQGAEQCDGPDLGGQNCSMVLGAQYRGTLACQGDCTFDTGDCCLIDGEMCSGNGDCCSNNCQNGGMMMDFCMP